eukprot:gnl/Chilomastix_caulleri/4832.p1 GENE.gnl/Chilomastix_caulleri/4832~~gnl/Chilomastix_caulleri/4832.p1  ORF type:complete len:96 (+),score=41.79 gnl/Chilomastix_caulleri/4832:61-348(+)
MKQAPAAAAAVEAQVVQEGLLIKFKTQQEQIEMYPRGSMSNINNKSSDETTVRVVAENEYGQGASEFRDEANNELSDPGRRGNNMSSSSSSSSSN